MPKCYEFGLGIVLIYCTIVWQDLCYELHYVVMNIVVYSMKHF